MSDFVTKLQFVASWSGEEAAGLRAGYEEIEINFKYGIEVDQECVEFWRNCLRDYFDTQDVATLEEHNSQVAKESSLFAGEDGA